MLTTPLDQLRCGCGFQPATIENPRTVWQRMLGYDFPAFDRQTERNTTHA